MTTADQLMSSGQMTALGLFQEMAVRVPAYRDFLKRHGVKPEMVKTAEDFRRIPLMDKENYLRAYPLPELCWDGQLSSNYFISSSSGSSGNSFFWPRGLEQDQEGAILHKNLFDTIFETKDKKTLLVICFSMGTWIAGSFTTASAVNVAKSGEALTIVTPGLEKLDAIKSVKNLGSMFDQIILAGYPPFLKDIIDEGTRMGVSWKERPVKLLMAGESFSEEWRSYVLRKVGSRDPYRDSASIYGSADATMLGYETPASVALRRLYNKQKRLRKTMFGTEILPSIVQFDPTRRFFEAVNGELVFSARAGLPLLRYNIHDTGGVYDYDDLIMPIKDKFYDLMDANEIPDNWRQPFVYLNGRKDFTATIYAVNIYPENIKSALLHRAIAHWVTGRFTMATKYHSDMDQYLEVDVELQPGIVQKPDMVRQFEDVFVARLRDMNAEYRKLYAAIGAKATPVIKLMDSSESAHFGQSVKHGWIKKEGENGTGKTS